MKKMMLIAAVIFAAIAANAASTSWKFTATVLKDSTGATYAGTLVLWASGGDLDGIKEVNSWTAASGSVANKTFTSDLFNANQTYDFFFTLEDSAGKTFTSDAKPVMAQATSQATIGFGNMSSATGNSKNWVAAPEPTSALLMLLGMAGLALKRKRA